MNMIEQGYQEGLEIIKNPKLTHQDAINNNIK